MSKVIAFFAARRKALVPFVPAVVLVSNFYLGVPPASHMASGTMWSAAIGLILTAVGVHTVSNDKPTTPPVLPPVAK